MYFTLAVSAATPEGCAALTDRARITDPAVLPVPGPAAVAWRSPDGRAALLHWGGSGGETSRAGTIWAGPATPSSGRAPVCARTTLTRVDPVYVAEVPGAVVVSDRATWAASVAGRLSDHDPVLICALLNPGFPLGAVTPFAGVSALPPSTILHALSGVPTTVRDAPADRAAVVATALVAAVTPLREAGEPVELSLTGG